MTREEKQKAIDALKISAPVMAMTQEEFNDYIQTLNKVMDWLEQEPTKNLGVDCISREQVIDELKRYFHDEYYQRTSIQDCRDCFIEDVLNHLPSITSQPCEDAISRQAVLDLINADWKYEGLEIEINNLPSVTPQEPTIKALGEELRKARKGIADEKVLIGFNMAVAICNKHLGESEDKE